MATSYEKYGQSTSGVDLYWTIFPPVGAPGQTFPAIIGLHPGGYHAGSAVLTPQGKDCASQGFVFFGTEYRLAPPSKEMNTPLANPDDGFAKGNHPSPGQDTAGDHGYAPGASLDVSMAVRAARAHPLCDGRVYGLGGSAGAALVVYNLLTATEGDDKFDLGVSCSIGVFDLYRTEIWSIPCSSTETCPHESMANWLNITDTYPVAPTGADLVIAKNNSASFVFNASKLGGKHWAMLSNRDSRGIPTSSGIAISSYEKDGTLAVAEGQGGLTVATGFLTTAIAAGMSESTADVPEAGLKYKFSTIDVASQGINHAHAFNYWGAMFDGTRKVSEAIIEWFQGGAVQTGGAPSITSFEPETGFAGVTAVVITGENFGGTLGVRFNHVDALSFTIDSSTQITAIPPIGATTGLITVRTAAGTVDSDDPFTVETQTIVDDTALVPRTPILIYPFGGLPPVAPQRPSPPRSVEAHASGITGSHVGEANWLPPLDTSGATLLNYVAYLTSDTTTSGTVPDVFGSQVKTVLNALELETVYQFHIAARTIYGTSDEIVVEFTSNDHDVQTQKDEPRGSLCLLKSSINPLTGKHEVDPDPANFWGNPLLAGSRYRTSWDTLATNPLDPNDTTYLDWSDVDAYIDKCEQYDQFAGISVAAGIFCPPWVINDPTVRTIDVNGPKTGTMPVPWSPKYLNDWIAFINAFGDRYDNRDGLSYFVIGGLGQVIETEIASAQEDLDELLADAQIRGFGTITEGWMFAANRILFACSKAFKHTRFLLSLAKVIPDSFDNGSGSQTCYDVTAAGKLISPTNFGVMNAGLNADSAYEPPNGFPPNIIIHDESPNMSCGFQFAHESTDVTDLIDTIAAGATTLKGKFLELYVDDATSVDSDYTDAITDANTLLADNP